MAQAFLKGLTFEQLAQQDGSAPRSVQFRVPPGSAAIWQRLPGSADFNAATEVLNLIRPGFGWKDAPRLWSLALQLALKQQWRHPAPIDSQRDMKHAQGELVGIGPDHVDEPKCAAQELERKRLI